MPARHGIHDEVSNSHAVVTHANSTYSMCSDGAHIASDSLSGRRVKAHTTYTICVNIRRQCPQPQLQAALQQHPRALAATSVRLQHTRAIDQKEQTGELATQTTLTLDASISPPRYLHLNWRWPTVLRPCASTPGGTCDWQYNEIDKPRSAGFSLYSNAQLGSTEQET